LQADEKDLVVSEAKRITKRRTFRWLSYLLLVVVLMGFVFTLITTRFYGWRFDAVLTGSMSPTYKIGGMVVIHPVDPLAVDTGDVITYQHPVQPDLLITHRVVAVLEENNSLSFQTKGDGVEAEDSYTVPSQTVTGRVCLYVPLFGHFAEFVKTPLGFTICLIVPCALLAIGEYRKITALISAKKRGEKKATTRQGPSTPPDSLPRA
jgi:signal peptidase